MEKTEHEFTPRGVCAQKINFDIDENDNVCNVSFSGGCNGNLKAIGLLVEGKPASQVAELLAGNTCGPRSTSCADQFSCAINEALESR